MAGSKIGELIETMSENRQVLYLWVCLYYLPK